MALPKKASRKIVVDGKSYLWMIRDNQDHNILAVQLESGSGQKLVVTFSGGGWRYSEGFSDLKVTPGEVSKLITEAKCRGWSPSSLGSPQSYNIRNGDELLGILNDERDNQS